MAGLDSKLEPFREVKTITSICQAFEAGTAVELPET